MSKAITELKEQINIKTKELNKLKIELIVQEGKATLDKVAHLLKDYPTVDFAVHAHHWNESSYYGKEESTLLYLYDNANNLIIEILIWDRYSKDGIKELSDLLPIGTHDIELDELEQLLTT